MESDYGSSMGVVSVKGSKSSGKKVLESIDLEPSENGGFVARCRHTYRLENGKEAGPYLSPEVYTFESKKSLLAFLTEKL